MNKIFLLGHVGIQPESKDVNSGLITKFTLATNEVYKDSNGEKKQNTTWFNITCFGKLAEVCAKHVSKGMQMLVEGKVSNRTFEKEDGTKGFSSEVIAQNIRFVGQKVEPKESQSEPNFDDSEIPF